MGLSYSFHPLKKIDVTQFYTHSVFRQGKGSSFFDVLQVRHEYADTTPLAACRSSLFPRKITRRDVVKVPGSLSWGAVNAQENAGRTLYRTVEPLVLQNFARPPHNTKFSDGRRNSYPDLHPYSGRQMVAREPRPSLPASIVSTEPSSSATELVRPEWPQRRT